MADKSFWNDKKVFITGHTGFKGSWLSIWLHSLGAQVAGYALEPPTRPSLFDLCGIDRMIYSTIGDVRDGGKLAGMMCDTRPEIVIHMAAQPLVRESYRQPAETYAVNVLGTVNMFEAVRGCKSVKAVVNVTSDKCYLNKEWFWGYRENEPLGGYDPYSSSKACAELVTSAYQNSCFNLKDYTAHGVGVASARAGNVIGGGDWAIDRLIPDCIRALLQGKKILIRNPTAVRPWQHVLEPLNGYLTLVERLYKDRPRYTGAWNFGPHDTDARPVEWIVKKICAEWGDGASYEIDRSEHPHEAHYLKLDCSKAMTELEWSPRWNIDKAIESIIELTRAYKENLDLRKICLRQIEEFSKCLKREEL